MLERSEIRPQEAWEPFEPGRKNPWTNRTAAHLMRRAGLGGSIKTIARAQTDGLDATLAGLFDLEAAKPYDQDMKTSGRLLTGGQESKGLAAWWLLRMLQSPCPLQEKMTLFWHGHFATGADKVGNARAMLRQNELLREHALQKFGPLVTLISRDVAMLVYLDSTENRKTRPNENYARELMELFCLGPGNYTESDIKEIARCFTGWEVRRNAFNFNPYQHDKNTKSFLGTNGDFDGDAAIQVILQQPAASRFIAKKMIRYFVFDDDAISDELAAPIATVLQESNFDIRKTLATIFRSRIFYSDQAIARKIKSPVELAIGVLRFFDASINMQQLGDRLQRLGQLPLYPPNVKGWDGGKTWINAATILARGNLVSQMLNSQETHFSDGNLDQWIKKHKDFGVGDSMDWVNEYLFAEPLPPDILAVFQTQFKENPAVAFSSLAALPAFQLN